MAAAFAQAKETAKIAFAPNSALLSVPSNLSIKRSISFCSNTSTPINLSAIILFTLLTAFKTPLPINTFLSPSRSSTASCAPVLAPLGTAARPIAPSSVITSTSTVGLPRESKICLA